MWHRLGNTAPDIATREEATQGPQSILYKVYPGLKSPTGPFGFERCSNLPPAPSAAHFPCEFFSVVAHLRTMMPATRAGLPHPEQLALRRPTGETVS